MADQAGSVTTHQLASYLGLTMERVRQMTRDGMPSVGRGQYDILKATHWYFRMLQEANRRRTEPGGVGGADALRKERAEAAGLENELRRIQLYRQRAELIPVAEAVRMFGDAMAALKSRMLSERSRIAVRMMGVRSQAEASTIFEAVVEEALGAMSKVGDDWKRGHGSRNGKATR